MKKKEALRIAYETSQENKKKLQGLKDEIEELKKTPTGAAMDPEFVANFEEMMDEQTKFNDKMLELIESGQEVMDELVDKTNRFEDRLNELGKQVAGKKKKKQPEPTPEPEPVEEVPAEPIEPVETEVLPPVEETAAPEPPVEESTTPETEPEEPAAE